MGEHFPVQLSVVVVAAAGVGGNDFAHDDADRVHGLIC